VYILRLCGAKRAKYLLVRRTEVVERRKHLIYSIFLPYALYGVRIKAEPVHSLYINSMYSGSL
jgi:hypothetical protein